VYTCRVGFFRGFFAPFRGASFVARERLWKYLVAPLVVNVLLGATTMVVVARYFRVLLTDWLTKAPVMGWIFLAVMTVLGGVVLFIAIQPLLGAIFSDRLSEAVERRVRGNAPSAPFLASTGLALVHGLLKLVLYALALVVGALLTSFLGPLGTLIGVGLGAIFLAYDGFDYPLSRRSRSFGSKWAYLVLHPGLTLGYGLGSALFYAVPVAGMLMAPSFTAAGATLAFLDADAKAEARAAARRKATDKPAEKTVQPAGRVT
jgi:uncharacterized protein involved in cysteine biosynthesis